MSVCMYFILKPFKAIGTVLVHFFLNYLTFPVHSVNWGWKNLRYSSFSSTEFLFVETFRLWYFHFHIFQSISALCVAHMSQDGICSIFKMSSVKKQVCLGLFLQLTKVLIYKARCQSYHMKSYFLSYDLIKSTFIFQV